MDGGAGNDTMLGGYGDDSYYVDSASDVVRENDGLGQGIDVVYSAAVSYTLTDSIEILSLDTASNTGVNGTGNAGNNTIFGNANDNTLERRRRRRRTVRAWRQRHLCVRGRPGTRRQRL